MIDMMMYLIINKKEKFFGGDVHWNKSKPSKK